MKRRRASNGLRKLQELPPPTTSKLQVIRDLVDESASKLREVAELQARLYELLNPLTVDRAAVRAEARMEEARAMVRASTKRMRRQAAELNRMLVQDEHLEADIARLRERVKAQAVQRRKAFAGSA